MKLLLTKGILTTHPPICDCDGCRISSPIPQMQQGPITSQQVRKQKSFIRTFFIFRSKSSTEMFSGVVRKRDGSISTQSIKVFQNKGARGNHWVLKIRPLMVKVWNVPRVVYSNRAEVGARAGTLGRTTQKIKLKFKNSSTEMTPGILSRNWNFKIVTLTAGCAQFLTIQAENSTKYMKSDFRSSLNCDLSQNEFFYEFFIDPINVLTFSGKKNTRSISHVKSTSNGYIMKHCVTTASPCTWGLY